ncbi:hypothetical protein LCGC14_2192540 [marine sediment metagenome]|uniref:Uncharacterized protein n=2 Tax=root TaxID=1 RepID=A0A831QN11_9FLAO|nr:hypothetical protein [Pricia antarctica]
MGAIKEPYEKYLTVSALIYSMCLETFKSIGSPGISSEMAEKIVLEAVTMIAKQFASCEIDWSKL